ncbi:MAG: WhiB family transcriptional regulator [Actinomycetota bacterium]|nr:WhiB family transcriptional regulator [Actinomycetota bacterium]
MSASARFLPAPVFGAIEDREWVDFAICRTRGALFFEPFGERPGPRRRREAVAKRLCSECPVHEVCLDAGRRNHESGIWGGETEEERALAGYPPRANVRRSVVAARNAARAGAASPDRPGDGHEAA